MASIRGRINAAGQYAGTSVLWRESGKQRSKLFASSAEAKAFKLKVEAGVADTRVHVVPLFGPYVLNTWLPRAGYAAGSLKNIHCIMRNDLAVLADRPLVWVATHRDEVAEIIAASPRTDHAMVYAVVKKAMDEAVVSGIIPTHRLAGLKVQRNHNHRGIIPTTAEQREHIAAGLDRFGLAVWLMHGCGLRISEALGLHGSDFRDGFTTVRVQRQSYLGEAAPLKSRKPGQYRDVPVPAAVAAKVRAHATQHGIGPLFPGRVMKRGGNTYATYETVERRIRSVAAEVGLEGFSAHQFRHGFVTALLAAGVPVTEVSKWTGDGIKILGEVYAHVTPGAFDRARAILDAAL